MFTWIYHTIGMGSPLWQRLAEIVASERGERLCEIAVQLFSFDGAALLLRTNETGLTHAYSVFSEDGIAERRAEEQFDDLQSGRAQQFFNEYELDAEEWVEEVLDDMSIEFDWNTLVTLD